MSRNYAILVGCNELKPKIVDLAVSYETLEKRLQLDNEPECFVMACSHHDSNYDSTKGGALFPSLPNDYDVHVFHPSLEHWYKLYNASGFNIHVCSQLHVVYVISSNRDFDDIRAIMKAMQQCVV
jgi:hypothetical protein